MNTMHGPVKAVPALVLSVVAAGLFSVQAALTSSFSFVPNGSPVVGQEVQFRDTSSGGPASWMWDFGDGQTSTLANPTHVFQAPGIFIVTLTATNASGSSRTTQSLIVSTSDTLRLNDAGNHPFTVTIVATNQHNGNVTGVGQAIPQSDLFGYFSFPSLTGNPDNPEVFVKILDGTPVNGQFWVFYGHLTDLIYDLTVTEVATGIVKTYHKDAGNAVGGFDTSGFQAPPAATPTPTPAPPSATPTPTPTVASTITVNLVASDFRWDFDTGGSSLGESFTFHVGQPYMLRISRRSGSGSHAFSGAPSLGCNGASLSPNPVVCSFTPTAAQIGTHFFGCTNSGCGSGHNSPAMQGGMIIVAP
jgi:PKD repeat protein